MQTLALVLVQRNPGSDDALVPERQLCQQFFAACSKDASCNSAALQERFAPDPGVTLLYRSDIRVAE